MIKKILITTLVAWSLLEVTPWAQVRLGIRVVAGGGEAGVIDTGDMTFNGSIRASDFTGSSYPSTLGGYVDSNDKPNFFYVNSEAGSARCGFIGTVTSTTVFETTTGTQGCNHAASDFATGDKVCVMRAADGAGLPECTVITNISGAQITVSPALPTLPQATATSTLASAASNTVFTVASGEGSKFPAGTAILLYDNVSASSTRLVSNRSGDVITLSQAAGFNLATGHSVYRQDTVSKIGAYYVEQQRVESASDFHTTYTSSGRTTRVRVYSDIFNGKFATIRDGVTQYPMRNSWVSGMSVDQAASSDDEIFLYVTFNDAYDGSNHQDDYNLMLTVLTPSTGASVSYGPWKVEATDGDAHVWKGSNRHGIVHRCHDGSMGGLGAYNSALTLSTGPAMYCGGTWPTTASAEWTASSNLALTDRYADHYEASAAGVFSTNGTPVGTVRSYRRLNSTDRAYYFEDCDYAETPEMNCKTNPTPGWSDGDGLDRPVAYGNPAYMPGNINTWATVDSVNGFTWLDGTHKRGALFFGSMCGASGTPAHMWYQNAGVNPCCKHGFGHISCRTEESAAVPDIAGPVCTNKFPSMIIYDTEDLESNLATDADGYEALPVSEVDMYTAFGIVTAPQGSLTSAALSQPVTVAVAGGWEVYVSAPDADLSAPCASNSPCRLIHKFTIADAAEPLPVPPPFPILPLAVSSLVLVVRRLKLA